MTLKSQTQPRLRRGMMLYKSLPLPMLFLPWVTSSEHRWVTLTKRRSPDLHAWREINGWFRSARGGISRSVQRSIALRGQVMAKLLSFAPNPGLNPLLRRCRRPTPVPPTTPNDKSREFIAIALTENAAKQGRHTTFVACGKNGAKDSLCIIDSDAPEDGYVTKTGSNDKFAQQLYQLGFRHLAISNGRNGFWGADILQDKFTPHQGGAKLQYPDSLNMKPHAVNASWQSASDASTLLDQESKKSRDMGQHRIGETKVHSPYRSTSSSTVM